MPNSIEKRTINELIARYEFEPTLKDIYVEGNTDKNLIEWFLTANNLKDITVYEISSVEVPFTLIQELSNSQNIFLEDNHRGRVITLAYTLDGNTARDLTENVACIADADFNHLLERNYSCRLLLFTEYAAIEMYLFDEQLVDKFLNLFIRNFPHSGSTILPAFELILRDLFFLRAANQELKLGASQLDFGICCTANGINVQINFDNYVYRYLNGSSLMSRRNEVLEKIEVYKGKRIEEARQTMHGHDFVNLLYWYVNQIKRPRRDYDKNWFSRGLFACLEVGKLEDKPLFAELIRRFT